MKHSSTKQPEEKAPAVLTPSATPPADTHLGTLSLRTPATPVRSANFTVPPSAEMGSCPATLDGLPLELKMCIIENLEELDPLLSGSTLCDEPDFVIDIDEYYRRPRWKKLSVTSRQNILNIRQVSPSFCEASWKSFGKLISDLQFRLVPADIADLGKISELPKLTPWIKALTFGTGGFEDSRLYQRKKNTSTIRGKNIQALSAHLQNEDERSEFETIISKYHKACDDQNNLLRSPGYADEFALALKAMPRLHCIRFNADDWIGANKSHLRGWLGRKEREFFDRVWNTIFDSLWHEQHYSPEGDHIIPSTYSSQSTKLNPQNYSWIYSHNQPYEGSIVVARIAEAIKSSGTRIQDLRQAGYDGILWHFQGHDLLHLQTLRIGFDHTSSMQNFRAVCGLVRCLSTLRYFEIAIPLGIRIDWTLLCKALISTPSAVERLHLDLDLLIKSTQLHAILNAHASSLCSVLFNHMTLIEEPWDVALSRIAAASFPRLKYIGIGMASQECTCLEGYPALASQAVPHICIYPATFPEKALR
ncbi:hypothetical protein BU16DRAFT_619418 [Lophium mytilinum]|uniref:Uncharacterized protein n=1 Tax=Lophium mytilinum TaxID=390894 RepID=A0A6A6QQ33_9PEZI|nr:hypothetical protein BU16DRAFT_619418 [Lophium mytilinum]